LYGKFSMELYETTASNEIHAVLQVVPVARCSHQRLGNMNISQRFPCKMCGYRDEMRPLGYFQHIVPEIPASTKGRNYHHLQTSGFGTHSFSSFSSFSFVNISLKKRKRARNRIVGVALSRGDTNIIAGK
jgi:hypothetical protein